MTRFWWFPFCLLLLLQACGFHLRGVTSLPAHVSDIQLVSGGLDSDQQYRLTQRLENAGARVRANENDQSVVLSVSMKTLPERNLVDSAGSGQRIVRLSRELTYSVVGEDGSRLVDNKSLVATQDIELDENNLLAGEDERRSAADILDDSLFNRLLIQLQRL